MPTHIGIGFSREATAAHAAREAALQAKMQTKQQAVHLALVFSTIHYSPLETIHTIRQTLGQAKIIGCSTAGILLSESVEMRGIAVLAVSSDEINFGFSAVSDIGTDDMRLAGTNLARNVSMDFTYRRRQVLLLLTDGLLKNNTLLLRGAQEILGNVFPIIGAGSSDDFRFSKSFQYYQDKSLTNSAIALLLGGKINIAIASGHGWKPLGKPRAIDEADGHIIKKIGGKKASAIYEEYFGQDAKRLLSSKLARMAILYPLGIYIEEENCYLLRNAIEILDDGCIICQGEVPQGAEVHLMIGNKDFCKEAAVTAAKEVQSILLGRKPKLIIIFESMARQKLLGRGAVQEIQMVRDVLGQDVPLIGMYSYGEIAPFKSLKHLGKSYLQNETITIFALT